MQSFSTKSFSDSFLRKLLENMNNKIDGIMQERKSGILETGDGPQKRNGKNPQNYY